MIIEQGMLPRLQSVVKKGHLAPRNVILGRLWLVEIAVDWDFVYDRVSFELI
jgi:hypothetical protein